MIEGDHVEGARRQKLQTLISARCMDNLAAVTRKRPCDKTAESRIVIDIEEPERRGLNHTCAHRGSGT
jgi:hypothetical protein